MRTLTTTCVLGLSCAILSGCSLTGPSSPTTLAFEDMARLETQASPFVMLGAESIGALANAPLLTLGAGDALGEVIFMNDVVLAAAERYDFRPEPAIVGVEVPADD